MKLKWLTEERAEQKINKWKEKVQKPKWHSWTTIKHLSKTGIL